MWGNPAGVEILRVSDVTASRDWQIMLLTGIFQPNYRAHLIQRLHDFDGLRGRHDVASGQT